MPLDATSIDQESHKNVDREARDMVASIMGRISGLHKPFGGSGSSSGSGSGSTHDEEEDGGVRVITLAGTNVGATMQGDMEGKLEGMSTGEPDDLSTYVNSNFQAVNNSIMMGGSYTANDPGVHLDILDFVERRGHDKTDKHGKKGKKKEKDDARSDHQTERSD
ncbi:hypothetical protein MLD38_037591 [Melastoma candidum]|uniref:Uncharacterized protein n=1 Tax=Melastoma candidum TaxID=119954 RepID=A0ACB9LPY2_9MYRT|nr:hypothetical protein MLD38_037591 [Melastoma candidum]